MSASDPDLLKLANDLRVACQIISRRVRFEGTQSLAPHHASVLGRVFAGPVPVGELAATERVSAPSMTRTINCLVEHGLVSKQPHPSDGRQVLVEITDAGRDAMARAVSDRDCWMVQRLTRLDAAKIAALRDLAPLLAEVAAS